MVFPLSNLPAESAPWARLVQSNLEDLIATTKANDINAAARNKQFTAAVKRLDGAITSLATKVGSVGSINFTGTQTFTPANAAAQALIARAYTGQTANIQEWQGNTGTVLSRIASDGSFRGTLVTPVISNGLREITYVTATGFAGYTYYWQTNGGVQLITANSTANGTLNITGASAVTLTSLLSVNDSISVTLMVTNGATPFYPNAIQIDGTAVTVKWLGGTAPTAGNASAVDSYTFVITKLSSTPTWQVLGTQAKFA